tara:strand:- start:3207 stop:3872 length:666 start_codon:yes stop_codon:yes gene_type:complete
MSHWNKAKRFTGWADIDLHDEGKSEARHAGQLIKDLNIEFGGYFTSQLKRAINSLSIILEVLGKSNAEIKKAWELNERHYGNLTSYNREEIKKKFGEKQVQIWRRSFDTRPPPMSQDHPYKEKIKTNISSESLEDTVKRVVPYYEEKIKPIISSKKNVLVVFHGNSCRALLMKIFNISKEKITEFEIPTGNPLLIKFDDTLKVKDYKYLNNKKAKKILFNV